MITKATVKAYKAPTPVKYTNRLQFSPYAWSKLTFIRDLGDTEVGFFAITAPDNPLFVQDIKMVKQTCTSVTVEFDDDAIADFVEDMCLTGYKLDQFFRIWMHTHPGNSASPSGTDETTFKDKFGGCDWAIMFILAKGGETYCRMKFNVGPGHSMELPVHITTQCDYPAPNYDAWVEEYLACVNYESWDWRTAGHSEIADYGYDSYDAYVADMLDMDSRAQQGLPVGLRVPEAYRVPVKKSLPPIKPYGNSLDEDAMEEAEEARRKAKDGEDYIARTCPKDVALEDWRAIMKRVAGQSVETWNRRGNRMLELNALGTHKMTDEEWVELQMLELEEIAAEHIEGLLRDDEWQHDPAELLEQAAGDAVAEEDLDAAYVESSAADYLNAREPDEMTNEEWDEYEKLLEDELKEWEAERAALDNQQDQLQPVAEGAQQDGGWEHA